jgi:hypothetical protein
MAFKTDRMSAQDRELKKFNRTLKSGSMSEQKPLSLAEQIAQAEKEEKAKQNAKPIDTTEQIRFAGWVNHQKS